MAGMYLPVALELPDSARNLREPTVQELSDSLVERHWIDAGRNGLAGKRIEFRGLEMTITDVLVRVEMLDGRKWTTIAHPSQPSVEIAASQTWAAVAATYVVQGVRHILFGADHMLFVLGLLLIVKDRWMLLKTVTAFTLAHSVTLAIATLGSRGSAHPPPAERRDCAEHSVSRPGDRSLMAWRNELDHPVSLGRGVCFPDCSTDSASPAHSPALDFHGMSCPWHWSPSTWAWNWGNSVSSH